MRLGFRMSYKCQRCGHATAWRHLMDESDPFTGTDCNHCGDRTRTLHHVFSFQVRGENGLQHKFP